MKSVQDVVHVSKKNSFKRECLAIMEVTCAIFYLLSDTLVNYFAVHEMTAGHRSLSGTISCVTDRIRFLPVTMTGRYSNFNSISYTEDLHE